MRTHKPKRRHRLVLGFGLVVSGVTLLYYWLRESKPENFDDGRDGFLDDYTSTGFHYYGTR